MDWILENHKIVSFCICDNGRAVLCLKILGEDPVLLPPSFWRLLAILGAPWLRTALTPISASTITCPLPCVSL